MLKIRSFLAFDIPAEVRKKLASVISDFKEKEKGIRWADPGNIHVTMRFFGSVEEELLNGELSEKIELATRGFGTARLNCMGIGVFPNWKYPRVIWAGFSGETGKVITLHDKVESFLSPFNLHEDRRQFRLHLTVGRTKKRLKNTPLLKLVEKLGPVNFGEVVVNRLVLYKSQLTKTGSIYTPLREFEL